jgi:hypothetical protein
MTIPTEGEVVLRPGDNRRKVVKVITRGNTFHIHMIYLKLAQ